MNEFKNQYQRGKIQLILASKSPRRIQIMRSHGFNPIVVVSNPRENIPPKDGMNETVMFLALKKAKASEKELYRQGYNVLHWQKDNVLHRQGDNVLHRQGYNVLHWQEDTEKHKIIIAADTIVYKDEIMGKPSGKEDGFAMLSKLRGTYHYVVTGVAIIDASKPTGRVFSQVTKVYFKDYTDEELWNYLDTDEAYDKAGGYAIQGHFAKYVEKIEGSYENVVGFPWSEIETELDKFCFFL